MINKKSIGIYKVNSNALNFFKSNTLLKKRENLPINRTLKIKVPILKQIPKKININNKSINKTNYDISFNKIYKYNGNNNNDSFLNNNKNPIKIQFDFEKFFFKPKIQKNQKDHSYHYLNKTSRFQINKPYNNFNEYMRLRSKKNRKHNTTSNIESEINNNNKNQRNEKQFNKKFAKSYDYIPEENVKNENKDEIIENNKFKDEQYQNSSSKKEEGELGIEDVKDIIIYFPFHNENKNNKYLFYKNDYNLFKCNKKNNYLDFFIMKKYK